jgi:hypothetical protein
LAARDASHRRGTTCGVRPGMELWPAKIAGTWDRVWSMGEMSQPGQVRFTSFIALFAILMALSAVPLFLTELPPLLDYPNHLARMHLLPSLTSPVLRTFYHVAWAPLPNLGMDGVVPFLALLMPLAWAGKVFVLLTFLLLAGGAATIYRVLFGMWSLWPCLAFLLLYTRLLLWGFMGYLFGCGLALVAFAAWIALRQRHWALRILLGCAFVVAIYLAHLLAFGIYAVMVAGYEVGQVWRLRMKFGAAARALIIGGAPFLPALALMAMNSSTGRIIYANPLRKIDLLFSVFDNYSRPFDVVCFVLVVLAVAFAFQRRWVKLAPEMAGPLIGLVILYLAMPTQLFTAAGADRRIPMMIFLVLIGGSQWLARSAPIERRFMGAAAALFAVRLAVIAATWHQSGRLYAALMPSFDAVPTGSCIAVAFDKASISVQKAPLTHFTALAVARRDAFVTTLFAYPMQQPITLQPEAQSLADLLSPDELWYAFVADSTQLSPAMAAALQRCGYIAFAGTKPFALLNSAGLEPAFVTPRFQLYRVTPSAPPAS